MKSINRVILMGNLASEVDIRETSGGHFVASFPIAINRSTKGEDGVMKEIADFHRIVAWEGLGKVCGKYLKKGMSIFIEGRLVNRSFEDKDGVRHYRTEVVAEGLKILTPKKKEINVQEIIEEEAVAVK